MASKSITDFLKIYPMEKIRSLAIIKSVFNNKIMASAKIFTYNVIFEKAKEGGYIAYVPALPGCMTQGETFEEAKENSKDAINAYLEVLKEDGEEIPIEDSEHIAATVSVPLKI